MPDREITNPGVRVGVCLRHERMEEKIDDLRARQEENMTESRDTLKIAQSTLLELRELRAEAKGATDARAAGHSSAGTWTAVVGLALAVVMAIVGGVWALGTSQASASQSIDYREMARAVKAAMRDDSTPRPAAPAPDPGG